MFMKKVKSCHYFQLLLSFILFGVFIFSSCNEKHAQCGDPADPVIQIALVDQNDSLLIGRKYHPDSIRLTVDNKTLYMDIEQGYIFLNSCILDAYNNDNYFLYLSKSDTDTLNLQILKYEGVCGTYYGFGGLKYNSKEISPVFYNKYVFKIIK
jgi:hypothetical protein